MKKLYLSIVATMLFAQFSYAQIDATINTTSIGLGATSTDPDYKFTYQGNSIGHYGLGWYSDPDYVGGSMGYLGGYAGLKLFTGGLPRLTITNSGNVGIGTTTPSVALDVAGATNTTYLTFTEATNVIGYVGRGASITGGYAETPNVFSLTYASKDFAIGGWNKSHGTWQGVSFYINSDNGNTGIGTINPLSTLQVDDGCSKASIGDASGPDLNFGTSYLGFNASRSGGNWVTNSDGGNNGGGVIYSTIFGDLYFANIPNTKSSAGQSLTDLTVKSNINFRISPDGITHAKQLIVELTNWPDYVFKKNYTLTPLSDLKAYIDANHHLPEIPSGQEVTEKGLNVGEMNKLLTKKVEELTLYLIEKDNKDKLQEAELNIQKELVRKLEQRLDALESKQK